MRSLFLLLILYIGFLNFTVAQDDLADYKRAKTLIGYGNYRDAMDLLRPYMDTREFGELSSYATYHFGYSAYQSEQYQLANTVLKPLVEEKSWRKIDDAHYLLALVYFKLGKNGDALSEIAEIQNPEIFAEAEKASYDNLKDASISFLIPNLSKFNKNKGFMLALKDQLERQTVMSAGEKSVYNQVKDLNPGGIKSETKRPKNNQILELAVILPFNHSGGSGVKNLSSGNFVFELYQGIKYASDELLKRGLKLNIKTFDSERNPEKLRNILADPFMKTADLIVGPIYPEETEIVASFAQRNDIPFVNPLSNVDDRSEAFESVYLFRPSVTSISEGIIDFMRKNIAGKRIAIAYSGATRDELLAGKLVEMAPKFAFQIVKNQRITDRNVRSFFEDINLSRNATPRADIVIVLSDDPNIAAPIFGLLESINTPLPVLVMDSWLYFNFANYEMLEDQNVHFIGNNPTKFESKELELFREGFYEKYQTYPSLNAHVGYELMYWVSETINPSMGFDFRRNLDNKGFQEGKISYGLDFRNSNNNQYVPVLKLEDGLLTVK